MVVYATFYTYTIRNVQDHICFLCPLDVSDLMNKHKIPNDVIRTCFLAQNHSITPQTLIISKKNDFILFSLKEKWKLSKKILIAL